MVFDLRSGLNMERIFSGPTYPRSQMFETYIRVNCHHVLASKVKGKLIPYLDAVELRFLRAKMIRKLSSINVEEPKMDIDILDTLTETQKRIS
jgi:hypothetical protein